MLAIPVSETIDDDSDYYGWTDNIIFLRNNWARHKISGNAVNSRNWQSSSIAAGNCNFRNLLGNTSDFFQKYEIPQTFRLKFNSLRSGPFGSTDPFIIKLFSRYNPDCINETATSDDTPITNENELHTGISSRCLEELLADSFDQVLAVNSSQDCEQPSEPSNSTLIEKNIYADQDRFWDMKFEKEKILVEVPVMSQMSNRLSEPPKIDRISTADKNDPIHEFPSNYLKPRNTLHRNIFAPIDCLQSDFQLVHA